MMVLEKDIEEFLKSEIEKLGGLFLKFTSPGRRGVPDRIVVLDGQVVFVELKTTHGKISRLQMKACGDLTIRGANAIIVKGKTGAEDFLKELKHGEFRN